MNFLNKYKYDQTVTGFWSCPDFILYENRRLFSYDYQCCIK